MGGGIKVSIKYMRTCALDVVFLYSFTKISEREVRIATRNVENII